MRCSVGLGNDYLRQRLAPSTVHGEIANFVLEREVPSIRSKRRHRHIGIRCLNMGWSEIIPIKSDTFFRWRYQSTIIISREKKDYFLSEIWHWEIYEKYG